MAATNKHGRQGNGLIRRVTELHQLGYGFDFSLNINKQILCVQNGLAFIQEALSIKLIDQVYDSSSRQFKYIHTVETDTGQKGILLLNHILFGQIIN
ncbi:hypothetical protein [Mucilaginibacter pedocola]|uniref:Uncharacterized protein n=1 Tax=Mucilaginibacter pedocola TaxID=1792845 RepID=A0A1S9PHA0_9SPHI|nr:hypothetical protein [Mucilaginibacter pedocola]OOQ60337.1 hypothetical protein BC343_25260 [Mucilaginibacter pedocola]